MKQISPLNTSRFNFGFTALATTTTETFSGAIDALGYEYALVIIGCGVMGVDTTTIAVYDCATAGGTYAAISGATTTVTGSSGASVKWGVVRLHGKQRYIKVSHDSTTGAVTSDFQCHVILFNPNDTAFFNAGKANSAAAGSESYSAAAFNVA